MDGAPGGARLLWAAQVGGNMRSGSAWLRAGGQQTPDRRLGEFLERRGDRGGFTGVAVDSQAAVCSDDQFVKAVAVGELGAGCAVPSNAIADCRDGVPQGGGSHLKRPGAAR